jgi:type IV fimbrial biogenesis protein FimT
MQTHESRPSGFTIVELMVTLAVAAILMGFALPAFNDFIRQRTMSSRSNDFVLAITYARSEAARRGSNVSVEALGAGSDNEWGEGYRVIVDSDGEVLREFAAMDNATMNAVGAGWHNVFRLTFNGRGMRTPQPAGPGSIRLCSVDDGVDPGRIVNMSVIGRPDSEELVCNP